RLRMMECNLAIDDFGAGYSSLQRLCELPFNQIKLDAHFVRELVRQPRCRAVVGASLANLGDFEGQQPRRHLMPVDGAPDMPNDVAARQLPGQQVERQFQRLALVQQAALQGHALVHLLTEHLVQQALGFQLIEKRRRGQNAALWMVPAHQHLGATAGGLLQVELGLVIGHELALLDPLQQLGAIHPLDVPGHRRRGPLLMALLIAFEHRLQGRQ
ncbi:EAL domain-containing protein, partial [Pseudomonas protegens]|nr:EAL domain-containing protein [Pseudomonas protegens]